MSPSRIYTLSLHDALPISFDQQLVPLPRPRIALILDGQGLGEPVRDVESRLLQIDDVRSEEHTSELQSHVNIVRRLLLEKVTSNGNFWFKEPDRFVAQKTN